MSEIKLGALFALQEALGDVLPELNLASGWTLGVKIVRETLAAYEQGMRDNQQEIIRLATENDTLRESLAQEMALVDELRRDRL